ncbi:hypothetical protein MCEMAEM4_03372 [Burkholderiaceae bacterium]
MRSPLSVNSPTEVKEAEAPVPVTIGVRPSAANLAPEVTALPGFKCMKSSDVKLMDDCAPGAATVAPLSIVMLPPEFMTIDDPAPSTNTPAALTTEPDTSTVTWLPAWVVRMTEPISAVKLLASAP